MATVSAGGIRAGLAYVELYLKDNRFARGLAAAQAKLKSFGVAVATLGKQMLLMDAAQLALFGLAARSFAKMGGDLLDMSDRTGVAVETLSEFSFAAGQTGSSLEEVEAGIGKMQKTLAAADEESKKAVETLAKLGIEIDELQGLTPEVQFEKLAEAISDIEDPAKRTAAAMEVFGKAGRKLIPMMRDFKALRQQARDNGLVFTREDAEKADNFGDKMDAVWGQMKFGWALIGGAVVPAIEKVVSAINSALTSVLRWLKENGDLIEHMFIVTAAFVAFDIAVFTIGKLLWGVGVVIGVVTAAIGALISVVTFLLTPLGLVIAGFGALVVALVRASDVAQKAFGAMGTAASVTFAGISDAIAAGDWGLALQIAWVGIKAAFHEGLIALKALWSDFIGWFEDVWDGAVTIIARGINALGNFFGDLFDELNPFMWGDETAQRKAARRAEAGGIDRELMDMANIAQRERDAKTAAERAEARKRIDAELAELMRLREVARAKKDGIVSPEVAARLAAGGESMQRKIAGVRGTFESNQSVLGRATGFGDMKVEDEQLKEQRAMRKNLDKIAAAAAAGGIAFWK